MPKIAMNYSKCCIYKIEHIENESLVYVGHTTNFYKRKGEHKRICMNENVRAFNYKLYQMIRDNGGFDRFKMIEVEKYPCKDKREALRREDEIMKELKASMNTIKSFLTEEERKKYRNEYLETNKEKIQEYYETNKEKIQEYKKDYYETNKEKIKEKGKQYREDNKYKINEKIICQCGSVIIRNSIKRHERTKKHTDLINPIQ
jgi:hypothetical protein